MLFADTIKMSQIKAGNQYIKRSKSTMLNIQSIPWLEDPDNIVIEDDGAVCFDNMEPENLANILSVHAAHS